MPTQYLYTRADVYIPNLEAEIAASAIAEPLDHITKTGAGSDNLHIWFANALTAGDVTILDGLIPAHSSTPEQVAEETLVFHTEGVAGTPQFDAVLTVKRGTEPDAELRWDEASDMWRVGEVGSLVPIPGKLHNLTDVDASAENPVDGQVLTFDTTNGWQPETPSGAVPPDATIAEATANTTTTSGTDVLVNSMTLTPAAGTYAVWFQGSIQHSSNNDSVYTSIYLDGSQIAASERQFMRGGSQGNVIASFACMAIVTVNGSQAIEGRWREISGGTATMFERQLLIMEVT